MNEFGKPTHFNLEKALEVAQSIINSDNVVGAMKFVDECLPAYYRENGHDLIQLWKHNVWKRVATINDYSSGEFKEIRKEASLEEFKAPRFQVVKSLVEQWNKNERIPYITDLGPGEYTLPIGLKESGLRFKYRPISITKTIPDQAMVHIHDVYQPTVEFHQPEIFVCFEMIEHLFHPMDIVNYYHRQNVNAEHILISTPNGALGGGWQRTNSEMIAHVRDWCPKELKQFGMDNWKNMNWQFMDGPQMLLIGNRINA